MQHVYTTVLKLFSSNQRVAVVIMPCSALLCGAQECSCLWLLHLFLWLLQAIPRINSQGQLFGAVYKVASERQLRTEDSATGGPAVTVERMQYIEEKH